MNIYEKTIKDLQDRVKSLEERLTPCNGAVAEPKKPKKPKKWSPVGGDWFINQCDDAVENWNMSTEETKQAGLERPTQQQAERAAVEMRKFNRLLALRDELCGDDENYDRWLHTLAFKVTAGKWEAITAYDYKVTTVLFSTKESAQRACDMLNSGEVEL
jgi:hypothetical protein